MSIGTCCTSPGVGSHVTHSQTHPSSHGSSHPSTTHPSTTQTHPSSCPSQTQGQPQTPTTLIAACDERRRFVVPQNSYGGDEEGQRSQEGGTNEGRMIEGQRNSKTRTPVSPADTRGRGGFGYGDEFPSPASPFTAASRWVSLYGGSYRDPGMDRAEYRYPQTVQSASTSTPSRIEFGPPHLSALSSSHRAADTAFCDKCLHVLRNGLPMEKTNAVSPTSHADASARCTRFAHAWYI